MTLAPRDGTDADQLMKNADLALYRAKADGRQCYSFFKPEMNDHIQIRRRMEIDLRKAFDEEQLQLHYQPILSLDDAEGDGLRGADALEPSQARRGAADRVHRPCRGDRADLASSANGRCGRPARRPCAGRCR